MFSDVSLCILFFTQVTPESRVLTPATGTVETAREFRQTYQWPYFAELENTSFHGENDVWFVCKVCVRRVCVCVCVCVCMAALSFATITAQQIEFDLFDCLVDLGKWIIPC